MPVQNISLSRRATSLAFLHALSAPYTIRSVSWTVLGRLTMVVVPSLIPWILAICLLMKMGARNWEGSSMQSTNEHPSFMRTSSLCTRLAFLVASFNCTKKPHPFLLHRNTWSCKIPLCCLGAFPEPTPICAPGLHMFPLYIIPRPCTPPLMSWA